MENLKTVSKNVKVDPKTSHLLYGFEAKRKKTHQSCSLKFLKTRFQVSEFVLEFTCRATVNCSKGFANLDKISRQTLSIFPAHCTAHKNFRSLILWSPKHGFLFEMASSTQFFTEIGKEIQINFKMNDFISHFFLNWKWDWFWLLSISVTRKLRKTTFQHWPALRQNWVANPASYSFWGKTFRKRAMNGMRYSTLHILLPESLVKQLIEQPFKQTFLFYH